MKKGTFLFIICLGILSCIDPIDIDIEGTENIPVVDGFITNKLGSHFVKLSFSEKFSNEINPKIQGARMTLFDSNGGQLEFVEVDNGLYSTPQFAAVPGVEYTLEIILPDGQTFISNPQIAPEPVNIDDAYYQVTTRQFIRESDNEIDEEEGISIYSPIENETSEKQYYKFEIIPTWIYEAPRARESSPFKYCYVTEVNRTFSILEDRVGGFDHKIEFLPVSERMYFGMSISVVKQKITKEAFDFWSNIDVQSRYNGSIFDVPPFSIRGNMKNIDNPESRMLGFFGVYSTDETRIYTDKDLLEEYLFEPILYNRDGCFWRRPRLNCFFCTEWAVQKPGYLSTTKPPFWPE